MASKKKTSSTRKKPAASSRKKSGSKRSKSAKQDTFLEQAIHNIEDRARKEIDELRGRIEDGIEDVKTSATQQTSKLEEAFDKRVAQAYHRLGLPAKADIDLLESKLDKLQKAVDALQKGSKASPATKTARKKTTRKKAVRK